MAELGLTVLVAHNLNYFGVCRLVLAVVVKELCHVLHLMLGGRMTALAWVASLARLGFGDTQFQQFFSDLNRVSKNH